MCCRAERFSFSIEKNDVFYRKNQLLYRKHQHESRLCVSVCVCLYLGHKLDGDGDGEDVVPAAPLKSSLLTSMGGHAFIFSRAASNCSWSKSKDVLAIFSGSPPRISGVSPLPWLDECQRAGSERRAEKNAHAKREGGRGGRGVRGGHAAALTRQAGLRASHTLIRSSLATVCTSAKKKQERGSFHHYTVHTAVAFHEKSTTTFQRSRKLEGEGGTHRQPQNWQTAA